MVYLHGWMAPLVLATALAAAQSSENESRSRNTRDQQSSQQRQTKPTVSASAGEIADNPQPYHGKRVRVQAEVENVFGKTVFTLDEDKWFAGPDVLVVAPGGIRAPQDGSRVSVTGTVRPFVSADIYRDYDWYGYGWYGYDWDYYHDVWVDWERRPVIMADSIQTDNGRELVMQKSDQAPRRQATANIRSPQIYGATAGQIAANPEVYYGKTVSVRSEIDESYTPHMFTLDEDRLFAGPDVLVVVNRPTSQPREGQTVTVVGTVERQYRDDLENGADWFDGELFKATDWFEAWDNDEPRPVIVARSVRTENGRELVQGPGTQRPSVGAPSQTGGTASDQSSAREITIVATDFEFQPSLIRAEPGQPLTIRLRNEGKSQHSIEFELPSGERELGSPVQPGRSAILRITAPEREGDYVFYCPVSNHHQKGMEGQLRVRRSPITGQQSGQGGRE